MKYFILFLLMARSVEASECADCLGNAAIANKMFKAIQHVIYGESGRLAKKSSIDPESVCKEVLEKNELEEDQQNKRKIISIVKNDLRTKKKTSGSFLANLSDDSPSEDITEAQVCELSKKQVTEADQNIENGNGYLSKKCRQDFLNAPLMDSCKKMVGEVRVLTAKKDEELREPPGEEIAPAYESDHNLPGADEASRAFQKKLQEKSSPGQSKGASKQ